jgi:hypothetical protein
MYKGAKTISWFHAASVRNLLKTYNLSAIYLPNGRQHEIPSDASNVNTFRYVFNHVFNTGLPILPNKQDYPVFSKGRWLPLKLRPNVFKNEYNK